MADFNKYSREAKKDPEFREELLHGDANQAIKARFGDDLPYEVECEEEITFKIKTSDSDFESVAGGNKFKLESIDDNWFPLDVLRNYDVTPEGNRVDYMPGSNFSERDERAFYLSVPDSDSGKDWGTVSSRRCKYAHRDSSGPCADFSRW